MRIEGGCDEAQSNDNVKSIKILGSKNMQEIEIKIIKDNSNTAFQIDEDALERICDAPEVCLEQRDSQEVTAKPETSKKSIYSLNFLFHFFLSKSIVVVDDFNVISVYCYTFVLIFIYIVYLVGF